MTLVDDARRSVRGLRHRPGSTALAVAILAVAVAVNAVVFAVVNAAFVKGPVLVRDPQRLVQITTTRNAVYAPDYLEWRARTKTLQDVALVRGVFHTLASQRDGPDTVFTTEVTPNTFGLLGVSPRIGRDFVEADAVAGAEPVVMLSHSLWQTRCGADPAVVGSSILVDGTPATVIGVMPEGFTFPSDQGLWTPLIPTAAALRRDTTYARYAYGRLRSGTPVASARLELEGIGQQLASAFPGTNRDLRPVVRSADEWFVGQGTRRLYLAVWGAAVSVLLIACTNVAGLLAVRGTARTREVAIQLALGASRWRLLRQGAIDGVLLAGAGGVLGLGVSQFALATLRRVPLTAGLDLQMDGAALAYVTAVSVATGAIAGTLSSAHVTGRPGELSGLSNRSGAASATSTRRLDVLVSVEIALAVLLVVGAGVMMRSVQNVTSANIGVRTEGLWTAGLYLPPDRYASADMRHRVLDAIRERLVTNPGIEAVAYGAVAPTDVAPLMTLIPEDGGGASAATAAAFPITPGYIGVVGGAILAGRDISPADRSGAPLVALVNQRLADVRWPGRDPVGQRLGLSPDGTPSSTAVSVSIVGVVSNISQGDRTRQSFEPIVYLPYAQHPQPNMFVFVRGRPGDDNVAAAIRQAVYLEDARLTVAALWRLEERLDRAFASERHSSALLGAFASAALGLAAVGLYTVVAYRVRLRTRELGVRVALGATPRRVVGWVAVTAAGPIGVGVTAGAGLAVMATRLLASQLVGVSASDPQVMGGALFVLSSAAAVACWVPARRALRIEPATALRMD
ncbi:MAG: ADOP family duplicated permease [Vicinamibacterales bacterium]